MFENLTKTPIYNIVLRIENHIQNYGQRTMKKCDISEILQTQLTDGRLDLRDEVMIVKVFQFCYDNEIEPFYQNLETTCKDFVLLKLIERTINLVRNNISSGNYLSEELGTKILNTAE